VSRNSPTKKIRAFFYITFRKDIGRKLMALFLAILVWVYVAQKVDDRKEHELHIHVVQGQEAYLEQSNLVDEGFFIILPENVMEISSIDGNTFIEEKILRVILSGPSERLPTKLVGKYAFSFQNLTDGSDAVDEKVTILREFFPDLLSASGIRVTFEPKRIDLRLAHRKEINISLSAANNLNIVNELPPANDLSYEPAQVTFDPTNVTLSGPAPEIDRIKKDSSVFKLETVDFSKIGIGATLQLHGSPEMLKKKITLRTRDNVIAVNLKIKEKETEESLFVPISLLDNGKPLPSEELDKIEPEEEMVEVVLKGRRSALQNLSDEERQARILVVIDLGGRRVKDNYDVDVYTHDLPDTVRVSLKDESKMVVRFREPEPASENN